MKTNDICLAIITKNRPLQLSRCLESIAQQSVKPMLVLVVDNSSDATALKPCEKYATKLNIKHSLQRGTVPLCRNFVLENSNVAYLGFVDDDCVLSVGWIEQALQFLREGYAFVLGKTHLLDPENVLSLGLHTRDQYWKNYSLVNQPQRINAFFDTKNVVLDLKTVSNHGLFFDETCQLGPYDSADYEFGVKLGKYSLKGAYCKTMVIYHQEALNISILTKKAFARGKLARYVHEKHKLDETFCNQKDTVFLLWFLRACKHFVSEFKEYNKCIDLEFRHISLIRRLGAYLGIKVFERYYAIGYYDK